MALYCTYPNSIHFSNKLSCLQNLEKYLPVIRSMGFSNIHILPFLKSPQKDRGYDVEDYFEVDSQYGTIYDLSNIINTSKKLRMNVFMDLIFNHVSNTHQWFQNAIAGDDFFRNFFIYSKTEPKLIYKNNKEAKYQTLNGDIIVPIMFPHENRPIPHWEQYNDGYWYYHTFYSFQLDLNWSNNNVFEGMTSVLKLWTDLGFNFRFDASPYLGGKPYKNGLVSSENLEIFKKLKQIAISINPKCIFIAESLYPDIYFQDNIFNHAYNFKFSANIWLSLLKEDVRYVVEYFKQITVDPKRYIIFLRNHDELLLSLLQNNESDFILNKLQDKGYFFGNGIAGTSFSFLNNNKKHYQVAYMLLCLFPGIIMITSGDEFYKVNQNIEEEDDIREIHRPTFYYRGEGFIIPSDMTDFLSILLSIRNTIFEKNVTYKFLNYDPEIFGIEYQQENNIITAVINISSSTHLASVNCRHVLFNLNNVVKGSKTILLHPLSGIIFES